LSRQLPRLLIEGFTLLSRMILATQCTLQTSPSSRKYR
jgi:hypothetical protein